MGVDVSLFGFSTRDYVLQSISTLYVPLLTISVLALGGLAVHRRLSSALHNSGGGPLLRRYGQVCLLVGLALAASALGMALENPDGAPLVVPLALAVGAMLAGYGGWLADTAARIGVADKAHVSVGERALRTLLLAGVVTLALFWEVSEYADVVGRGYAVRLEQSVPYLPRATAFSTIPLGIQAPGVQEKAIQDSASSGNGPIRYRTTGLRFLVRSGGRLFLLNDGWTIAKGVVVVLPDDNTIRWQFSR